MKIIKLLLVLSLFLSLSSCVESPFPMNIGGSYFLDTDGNNLFYVKKTDSLGLNAGAAIDPEVIAWGFDSVFIIAKQIPFHYIFDSIHNQNPSIRANEFGKLYAEIETYNYWIIDKRKEAIWDVDTRAFTNGVLGSFTYEEFLEKRKELGISDSLVFGEERRRKF
jgi:hypothetical protein